MKGWSRVSLTSMSYGYEMQITPLQMLTFYNAVANDGKWVRPMLVRKIKLADEVIEDNLPYVAPIEICKPETARKAQELLRGVVEHGTAKHINNPHYAIAGKPAPPRNSKRAVSGRKVLHVVHWLFSADNPKYSMITVVDSPKGDNIDLLYAGAVAAPVFKEVARPDSCL